MRKPKKIGLKNADDKFAKWFDKLQIKHLKFKIAVTIFTFTIIIINLLARNYPALVERYYSTSSNKLMIQALNAISGNFPFSLAEPLYYFLVIYFIYLAAVFIYKIAKGGAVNQLTKIITYLMILYSLYILLWGGNYNRFTIDKIMGFQEVKYDKHDLYNLCDQLITKANSLRNNVKEDDKGVMRLDGGYKSAFKRLGKGYAVLSEKIPELKGYYSNPKPVALSKYMSYTRIIGMYMPYTGEANVDVDIANYDIPDTAAHEMAHQRGFSREDEANYISYLACINNPDKDIEYSGVMLAMTMCMNQLADADHAGFKQLVQKYSPGVRRDLTASNKYWDKYNTLVDKTVSKINDSYLKSNGQNDGELSYGRMVQLLLLQYKNEELGKTIP